VTNPAPKDKRTIPELREEIWEIAGRIAAKYPKEAKNLRAIWSELHRASPTRPRAPVKHRPLSEREAEKVRAYAFAHPNVHLNEIANVFNTNPGRVSEALQEAT